MQMRRLMIPALFLAVLPACLESSDMTGPDLIACDPFLNSFTSLEGADTVTLESGISYIEVEAGTGEPAADGSQVMLNYTLYGNGTPPALETSCGFTMITTTLGVADGLLPSFKAGVPGMREGGVRRLIIPAELGYENPIHELYGVDLVFDLHAGRVIN